MAGVYEPSPVWCHFSAPVQNQMYIWGGVSEDVKKISLEDFKSSAKQLRTHTWRLGLG